MAEGVHEAIFTDAQLAQRGDRNAFARLVTLHQGQVYGLCVRLLGNRDDARDVAQEAFVRAWEHRAAFDPTQEFSAWVTRIARNAAIDRLRRRRDTVDPQVLEVIPLPGARSDELIETRDAQAALDMAINRLPPHYREVITLFHLQGRSVREVAAIVSASENSVLVRLFRARKALRDQLGDLA
jgi:RNA polymerase sigma-70 factor, ECF subfamily